MNTSFSLSFKVASIIHDHQYDNASTKIKRILQQQILDRILSVTIPFFAIIDLSVHCTFFAIKGSNAIYKSITTHSSINFEDALIHLKMASLFSKIVLHGILAYGSIKLYSFENFIPYITWLFYNLVFNKSIAPFILPKVMAEVFESSELRFARALLLSSCPEMSKNKASIGGTEPGEVETFISDLIHDMSKELTKELSSTLPLVIEAQTLSSTMNTAWLESKVVEGSFPTKIYKKASTCFEKFKNFQGPLVSKIFYNDILPRFFMLASPLVSSLIILYSISSIFANFAFCINSMNKKNKHNFFKAHLNTIYLDLIRIPKALIAIVVGPTMGVICPYKVQRKFFTDTYSNNAYKFIEETLKKIETLADQGSLLIPISVPSGKNRGHGICILVTKFSSNYRLSIIDRGGIIHAVKDVRQNKSNVDVSWDNIELDFVKSCISDLLSLQSENFIEKKRKDNPELLKVLGEHSDYFFLTLVYTLLESKYKGNDHPSLPVKYISHHLKTNQKIGNCGLASLLGAISFHSCGQKDDSERKKVYKKFVYCLKEIAFKKYGYLLDLDPTLSHTQGLPSEVARNKLNNKLHKLQTKYA